MLKQTSKSFRRVFILKFTKELIKNTEKYKELIIKSKVKKTLKSKPEEKNKRLLKREIPKKEQLKKIIHKKIKEETKRISLLKEETPLVSSVEGIKKEFKKEPKQISAFQKHPRFFQPLHIPEPALPETVRYIRPAPTYREIDLGKLNPLLNDPFVRIIECFSPDQKIVVSGTMGRKNTSITLTKEEIDEVIKKFSEASRIPVNEGIFNVAFGRLQLSSIISEVTSPKFIIKKMLKLPPAPAVSYS